MKRILQNRRLRRTLLTTAVLLPFWGGPTDVGNLDSSANWQEMSGLTNPTLLANADYLWALSDAPANMIAAVDKFGVNRGVLTLTGRPTPVDWEDVESRKVGLVNYLYIMDFGNNPNSSNSRGTGIDLRILRVVEPTITGSDQSTTNFISIDCAFPAVNGPTHKDCEASIIDENGKIWIITKRDATQKVYSLAHAATYTGTQTLVYEGVMTALPASTTVALTTTPCYAVDASYSPTNGEILVKNYSDVYVFPKLPGETVMQALQKPLVRATWYCGGGSTSPKASHPSQEPQGEGITHDYYETDLYSTSEYVATEGSSATTFPLKKYSRLPKEPYNYKFQDGVYPTAGYNETRDTYIWDTNATTNYGTQTTFVVDTAVGVETDQRKGILKFGIGSIPSNFIVTHAYIDLWLDVEGQGWKFHKMLVDWVETTSTYTSLGGLNNDGTKAAIAYDCQNGVNLDTVQGVACRNIMNATGRATIQSWINGSSPNYGWLIEQITSATGDGIQFASREHATTARHPLLYVEGYLV